ncbi:M26 family metallopeptidase [Natronolimnohabitans innermongolicus]|uniref:GLUG domain-containing protein n=1 Tax=Natronolimnohabitans innermongolicus JCM 12255 TaxID=1227499 RepID=L9X4Z3_9EURY|nr:hypothetical protein [Natronolimnohabitans innermongolicus]ELY56692.1 GLUG domain-containing protein [Natronolimnohabitans innermongolicus JCM 12255]
MPEQSNRVVTRGVSRVLLLAVLVTVGSLWLVGAAAADPRDGFAGSGTEADPFVVTTVEELERIDDLETYREDELDVEAFHYVLGNDIDASETSAWEGGAGFEPIGDRRDAALTGTFDGRNHTISNLHITRPSEEYVGLFGYSEGEIKNVSLETVSIVGDGEVGAIVGRNGEEGVVEDVSISGEIKGIDRRIGGAVGRNEGEVSAVGVVGDVESTDREIGGLIGQNHGAVDRSYFVGTVGGERDIGGVIGTNQGSLRSAFAAGTVEGDRRIAGVVGTNDGAVSQVYSLATVEGERDVAGIGGSNAGTVSNAYSAGTIDGDRRVAAAVATTDGIVEDVYWDLEATGQHDAFDDDDGNQDDVSGLEPWELTGENATRHATLDFDSTWTVTETYPRLGWEDDRNVPAAVYDLEVQTEPPEPESESETSADDSADDGGLLSMSTLWAGLGLLLLGIVAGSGFYAYRRLGGDEPDESNGQRRRRY